MASQLTSAPLLGEPLVVELMNTIWADREGVHDALEPPAGTAGWMRAVAGRDEVAATDLAGWAASATNRELAAVSGDLIALRDAARRLAARRTGDAREAALVPMTADAAVEAVNRLAAGPSAWPVLHWPDAGRPTATRDAHAHAGEIFVGDLARETIALFGSTAGDALRACEAPGCVLYFVKRHPRREWCSDACGNRARQARHYRRTHPGGPAGGQSGSA